MRWPQRGMLANRAGRCCPGGVACMLPGGALGVPVAGVLSMAGGYGAGKPGVTFQYHSPGGKTEERSGGGREPRPGVAD